MHSFPSSIVPVVQSLHVKSSYQMMLGNCTVHFKFMSNNKVDTKVVQAAAEVVRYLWPYRKCRNHSFTAEFFFCNTPKFLPQKGIVLEDNHVNTGYSVPCESLVVFRKQEWFKVFIHECFHYLGLDNKVAVDVRFDMFTIPIVVSLREVYCEVWARLLQCYFLGGLSKERVHSVRNMVRVLRHMNLTYADLWGSKGQSYSEKTNVFAYVVLTAILMHDYSRFVQAFNKLEGNIDVLITLVQEQFKAPSFLRRVAKAENEPSDRGPFRMSVIELKF